MTAKSPKPSKGTQHSIDVRDQECSKPVVAITNKLEKLGSGETLEVLANDSAYDDVIRIFGHIQKNTITEKTEEDFVKIYITKR